MSPCRLGSIAVYLLAAVASAQELVWRTTGIAGSRRIGQQTAAIGDINNDGHEDLATIVHGQCGAGPYYGFLWLISGRDGTLIREVPAGPPLSPNEFEFVARTGDMNGDGIPDYAVSHYVYATSGGSSVVEVRSGVDDSVIWSVPGYGDCILGDLDVDGDGLKDLVVGDEHLFNYLGEVRVYSHFGQPLYNLIGNLSGNPPLAIGICLARLGDIDDDGRDDFAMGCYEPTGRGAGVIVSGRTGSYLRVCYGELQGDNLGYSIDSCGDMDGDDYTDLVVGNGGGSFVTRGAIRAFSSRTGQVLHQWIGYWGAYSFSVASGGVDLDGDGMPDVVTGTPSETVSPQQDGTVYAYSGRDGSQLHRFISTPQSGYGRIGYWETTLQPPAGEHTGLIVVPDAYALFGGCGHNLGVISAYRGTPRTVQILGPACAGNLSSIPNVGMQSLDANGVRVHLSGAPSNVPSVLMLGLSTTQFFGVPLPASLDPFGLPGCSLRTSIELMLVTITGSIGQDAGYAHLDLPFPIPTTGLGAWSLSAQWLVLGDASTFPGGLTQAKSWRR